MERNVKIRLDGGKTIEQTVTGVTFGELKKELRMDFKDQKVIIRETRHTLEDDSAQLPLNNFTLFVYPIKVKSGGSNPYSDKSYHELRRLCIERNLSVVKGSTNGNYGTKDNMIKKLLASDKKSSTTSVTATTVAETCDCCKKASPTKEEVYSAINVIKVELDNLKEMVSNIEEVEIVNEIDILVEEYEKVRNILKPFGVA